MALEVLNTFFHEMKEHRLSTIYFHNICGTVRIQ